MPVRVHRASELGALHRIGKLCGFGWNTHGGIMLVLESLEVGGIQSGLHKRSSIHGVEKGAVRVQQPQGYGDDLCRDGGDMAEGWIITKHCVRKRYTIDGE